MKRIVEIKGERYVINDEDDLIFLVHMLASLDYSIDEIASKLGISKRKVRMHLENCW